QRRQAKCASHVEATNDRKAQFGIRDRHSASCQLCIIAGRLRADDRSTDVEVEVCPVITTNEVGTSDVLREETLVRPYRVRGQESGCKRQGVENVRIVPS